ncbi:SHOCT domain-containing protein [Kitasatospora sp. NPDC097643]|uniref:SHOCT domain-containing protein n=1 Tax=Kitasatospora sp. NPDC097643 TaxID=3157230 RepID=UPI0033258D2F
MLGRRLARGGRPGLVGTAARTAVVAGTATAVSGRVARHQAEKAAAEEAVAAPPPPPPPAQAPAGGSDAIANLERLAQLHEQGALSDAEFAVAKSRLLGL